MATYLGSLDQSNTEQKSKYDNYLAKAALYSIYKTEDDTTGDVAKSESNFTLSNGFTVTLTSDTLAAQHSSVDKYKVEIDGAAVNDPNTDIFVHVWAVPTDPTNLRTIATRLYGAATTTLPASGSNANGKIASAKAVYDLYAYANGHISQSAYGSNDVHAQYVLKRELVTSFHTTQDPTSGNSPVKAPSVGALYKLASALQAKGLLYGAARNNGENAVDLNTLITTGIYDVQSCTNGPTQDGGGDAQRSTVIVITESTISGSATASGGQNETVLVQILISKDSYNNMWYRTRYGSTTWYAWTRFAKTKRTFSTAASVAAATIQGYLKYCEPTIKCTNASGTITVTLPAPTSVMDGCRVNVEVHGAGTVNIVWGSYSYAATLTNGNVTYIPLESDGSSWYMICVG